MRCHSYVDFYYEINDDDDDAIFTCHNHFSTQLFRENSIVYVLSLSLEGFFASKCKCHCHDCQKCQRIYILSPRGIL